MVNLLHSLCMPSLQCKVHVPTDCTSDSDAHYTTAMLNGDI